MKQNREESSHFVIKVGDLYYAGIDKELRLTQYIDGAYIFKESNVFLIRRRVSALMEYGIKIIKIMKVTNVTETYEEEYRLESVDELRLVKSEVNDEKSSVDLV